MTKANTRRAMLILWLVLCAALLGLLIYPVRSGLVRVAVATLWIFVWAGALWIFRRRRVVRYPLLALAALAVLLLCLPGRAGDPASLRKAYTASLRPFEDAPYVWGGENGVGIDCSGLVRQGLIRANIKHGLLSLNGDLLREALSLWWHDCTAASLHDEYRDKTRFLFEAPSINELDHTALLPGDIALTSAGRHTLAYLGDRTWIEADPALGRVVIVKIPSADIPSFKGPARLMRWRQLDDR